MKLAVFSDSHGRTEKMIRAVKEHEPDIIVHLGDFVKDAEVLKKDFPRRPFGPFGETAI